VARAGSADGFSASPNGVAQASSNGCGLSASPEGTARTGSGLGMAGVRDRLRHGHKLLGLGVKGGDRAASFDPFLWPPEAASPGFVARSSPETRCTYTLGVLELLA
jgi:hypothetical protein